MNEIKSKIRDIENFPKEGIIFKDITPVLNDSSLFKKIVEYYDKYRGIDFVCGIESRGFIFGSAVAYFLNAGFVPIRKQGKLPYETISFSYELEYGTDTIEIHKDAFRNISNPKVLLIDDLIATGGTALAAVELIKKLNADIVAASFIIELTYLDGAKKLIEKGINVDSLIKF